MFRDGVAGPPSFSPITPIFAAGGAHHVYLAESPEKKGTFAVVVDGKPTALPAASRR